MHSNSTLTKLGLVSGICLYSIGYFGLKQVSILCAYQLVWLGYLGVSFCALLFALFAYLFIYLPIFEFLDDSDSGSTTLSLIRVEHTKSVLIEFGFRFDARHTRSIILGHS